MTEFLDVWLVFLTYSWPKSVEDPANTDACQVYIKRNHTIAGAFLDPQHVLKLLTTPLKISSYLLYIVSADKLPLPISWVSSGAFPYSAGVHEILRLSTQASCSRSFHIDDLDFLFNLKSSSPNVIWFTIWRPQTWRVSSTHLESTTPIWELLAPPLNIVLQDMGVNNLMEELFHGSKKVPQIGRAYLQQSIALVSVCRQIVPHVGLDWDRREQLEQ